MLLSFSVENMKSIRDRQTLVMEATGARHLASSRVADAGGGVRVLKSAAVYGANGSGKSTLLAALHRMASGVVKSMQTPVDAPLDITPFLLDTVSSVRPSVFDAEFIAGDGVRYRYGFGATPDGVVSEWLTRIESNGRETELFTREGAQAPTVNDAEFPEGKVVLGEGGNHLLNPKVLMVSLCEKLNGPISKSVAAFFTSILFMDGQSDESVYLETVKLLKDDAYRGALASFAVQADFGIDSLAAEDVSVNPGVFEQFAPATREILKRHVERMRSKIKTGHKVYDEQGRVVNRVEFDLRDDESSGTQRFVSLAGPLLEAVRKQRLIVIDEFDARLHPLLAQALIRWFHSEENAGRAQLLIATHDVLLMDPEHFRRDQIWFCKKDQRGATTLYCMDEFDSQTVRNSSKFSRAYLQRVFGAVPDVRFAPGVNEESGDE